MGNVPSLTGTVSQAKWDKAFSHLVLGEMGFHKLGYQRYNFHMVVYRVTIVYVLFPTPELTASQKPD